MWTQSKKRVLCCPVSLLSPNLAENWGNNDAPPKMWKTSLLNKKEVIYLTTTTRIEPFSLDLLIFAKGENSLFVHAKFDLSPSTGIRIWCPKPFRLWSTYSPKRQYCPRKINASYARRTQYCLAFSSPSIHENNTTVVSLQYFFAGTCCLSDSLRGCFWVRTCVRTSPEGTIRYWRRGRDLRRRWASDSISRGKGQGKGLHG